MIAPRLFSIAGFGSPFDRALRADLRIAEREDLGRTVPVIHPVSELRKENPMLCAPDQRLGVLECV